VKEFTELRGCWPKTAQRKDGGGVCFEDEKRKGGEERVYQSLEESTNREATQDRGQPKRGGYLEDSARNGGRV